MGLDNGIRLMMTEADAKKNGCPFIGSDNESFTEICYWRKCYGLRDLIIKNLQLSNDRVTYTLFYKDVNTIIDILIALIQSEDDWKYADSIWEYDEYLTNMCNCILRLKWLKEYWKTHSGIQVIFYDSH